MSYNRSHSYSSARVICPFYQAEIGSMIYCEGVEPGNCFHAAFADGKRKTVWKAMYCETWDYNKCLIARGHEELWRERENCDERRRTC